MPDTSILLRGEIVRQQRSAANVSFCESDNSTGYRASDQKHADLSQCRDRLIEELANEKLTIAAADQIKVEPFLPGYGHDREMAADREGRKLAAAAGYSPQAAVRLLSMYVVLGQQLAGNQGEAAGAPQQF